MTKFRNALHNEKGFTLIELLVVIIIIGILAAIAIPNLMGASDDAREKRLDADLRVFASALEVYYNENGEYPTQATADDLKDIALDSVLKSVPQDPWKNEYQYSSPAGATFTITVGGAAADAKATKHLTEDGIQTSGHGITP